MTQQAKNAKSRSGQGCDRPTCRLIARWSAVMLAKRPWFPLTASP